MGSVRMSEQYIERLRRLSKRHKRSMAKTLEVLIDKEGS